MGTSSLKPSDISAVDMQTELQGLANIGNVSVTRVGPDSQGGYTWSITFLTAIGNVASLALSNSLTGSDVNLIGATVQDGNYLGGNYTLEYNGLVTADIPFDASADDLVSFLAPIVGSVTVSQSEVTTEGGSSYLITFNDIVGPASLLIPFYDNLEGVNAVVYVKREVIGAVAGGTTLVLSFNVPLFCSQSEVPVGACGSPVTEYSIEVANTRGVVQQFVPYLPPQDVQRVRTAAPSPV